jgi:glycosyltransferase involved in cell wall biosynthesis
MRERPLRILVVPAKPWPSDHPVLESVFAEQLPARGHHVEWVMWTGAGSTADATWHGTPVHLTAFRAGSFVAAIDRWWLLLRRMVDVARRQRFDVVQVRNSTAAGLVALALCRIQSSTFAFQVSFPVPEWTARAARRGEVRAPTVRRVASWFQRSLRDWLVRRADVVEAISERMREELVRRGASPRRVVTLPLGADLPPEPDPTAVQRLRDELGLCDQHLILYTGSISPQRELGFLVRVAERVAERHDDVHWLLLGPTAGGEADRLREMAARSGLADRFQVREAVPRREVSTYLALATLAVSPVPVVPIYLVSSPAKTVESLAAGRPIVATPIPDQEAVLRGSGGGLVAPYRPAAFADAISSLLVDAERRAVMGRAGQAWVREHRSYERLASRLERALVAAAESR